MRQFTKRLSIFIVALIILVGMIPLKVSAIKAGDVHTCDVYLVLDNSKSMKKTDPDFLLNSAAKQFFNSTTLESRVGVITYSGKVESIGELKKKETADDTLNSFKYDQKGSNTNIGDALTAARDKLIEKNDGNEMAIVLITDGADNRFEQYNIVANGQVIPVYCVYINDGVNEKSDESKEYLSKLAKDSGTNDYIEIKSKDEIETKMDDICRSIYGTTLGGDGSQSQTVKLTPDTSEDVKISIKENVYTATGTISYTDEVALKIADPDGNIIYDAEDNNLNQNSNVLSVSAGKNISSVTMLWPDAGDYTFTVSSKISQEVKLDFVTINSGVDLTLDGDKVTSKKTITATCASADEKRSITDINLRIHDAAGNVVGNDIKMEDAGDGSFTYTLKKSDFNGDGEYFVVAVAETNDAKTIASAKEEFVVDTAKKIPIWIIPVIIIIIAIIIFVIVKILKGKKTSMPDSGNVPTSPISPIAVRIYGANGKGLLIYQNIQSVDIPNGQESELYDALEKRTQNPNLIPEEIKNVTVACEAPRNNSTEQTLVVRIYTMEEPQNPKSRQTLTKGKGRDLRVRLDSGDEIQFQWIGGAVPRR